MFGLRNYQGEYDTRNPKCAAIFHPMADELSKQVGGASLKTIFNDKAVRTQLDRDFESAKRAIQLHGTDTALENLHMQIALGTQSLKQRVPAIAPHLYGMLVTIPVIRSVVFGHGPGFATALRADPYEVTVQSCFLIVHVLGGCEQTEIVVGSRSLWLNFYGACVDVHGKP